MFSRFPDKGLLGLCVNLVRRQPGQLVGGRRTPRLDTQIMGKLSNESTIFIRSKHGRVRRRRWIKWQIKMIVLKLFTQTNDKVK